MQAQEIFEHEYKTNERFFALCFVIANPFRAHLKTARASLIERVSERSPTG